MTEAETENEQSASTSIVVASVIIRAKDEERDIGRTLSALASQTIASAVETIVVDSGSSDSTVEIVRGFGIEPIEISGGHFPMAEDPEALADLLDRLARELT